MSDMQADVRSLGQVGRNDDIVELIYLSMKPLAHEKLRDWNLMYDLALVHVSYVLPFTEIQVYPCTMWEASPVAEASRCVAILEWRGPGRRSRLSMNDMYWNEKQGACLNHT